MNSTSLSVNNYQSSNNSKTLVPLDQNLDLKEEGIVEKVSCDLCKYESVDNRRLSYRLCIKNQRKTKFRWQKVDNIRSQKSGDAKLVKLLSFSVPNVFIIVIFIKESFI